MPTLYFVTETYIKEITGISKNVDPQDVMPHTRRAADLHISLILGQEYYLYLLDAYNDQTLTGDEITLVEHIQPAVAWLAAGMALPFAMMAFKNKGPQTQSGEYSATPSRNDVDYLRNEYQNTAEYYCNRVLRFLKLNEDTYPGWTADSNKTDTPPDTTTNWEFGMEII